MKNYLIPAVLLAALAVSCQSRSTNVPSVKDPVKVKVLRVEKQPVLSTKTYVGRVESATDITVSSPF